MAKKVLNPKALALTLGIVWGAAAFLVGLSAMGSGYGSEIVNLFGSIYVGYTATVIGSIIGGIWAFVDAAIGGYIIAWLYNKFA